MTFVAPTVLVLVDSKTMSLIAFEFSAVDITICELKPALAISLSVLPFPDVVSTICSFLFSIAVFYPGLLSGRTINHEFHSTCVEGVLFLLKVKYFLESEVERRHFKLHHLSFFEVFDLMFI